MKNRAIIAIALVLIPWCTSGGQQSRPITISADTEIFLPGHRDFTRYTTPGWCQAAASTASFVERRTLEAQAILDTIQSPQDTIGVGMAERVGKMCGAHFAATSVPTSQLTNLIDLALLQQNDTLAQAALVRMLATAPTLAARNTIRMAVIRRGYLTAQPPRVAAAESLVAQIDRENVSAPLIRLQAHDYLLDFWQRSSDTAHSQHEAEQMLAIGQTLTAPDRRGALKEWLGPLWDAYQTLLTVAFVEHPDSMPSVLRAYAAAGGEGKLEAADYFGIPVHTTWEQLYQMQLHRPEGYGDMIGKPLPPIHATYWFAPGGDSVRPVPGRVNIFLGLGGAALANRVRRWLARYGNQGLVVTYVVPTKGYTCFLGHWKACFSGHPLSPAEEGQQDQKYFRDYEQLPVAVAVQETHFQWRPAPDGRRIQADTTAFAKFTEEYGAEDNVVLAGRDGSVLWNHWIDGGDGPELVKSFESLLAWAMAQPAETARQSHVAVSPSSNGSRRSSDQVHP